jgi:predicted exporter
LTLAGMAALPLVLGLAADHGIVVTHDLAHGMDLGVERAVLVASLTTLTGMGLLALARHPALKAMGEVIFWGLLIEVPAALWLLPRLCRASAGKHQEHAA